jgi:hypothetical protein
MHVKKCHAETLATFGVLMLGRDERCVAIRVIMFRDTAYLREQRLKQRARSPSAKLEQIAARWYRQKYRQLRTRGHPSRRHNVARS